MSAVNAMNRVRFIRKIREKVAASPQFWTDKKVDLKNPVRQVFIYPDGGSIAGDIVSVHFTRALMVNVETVPERQVARVVPFLTNLPADVLEKVLNEL